MYFAAYCQYSESLSLPDTADDTTCKLTETIISIIYL